MARFSANLGFLWANYPLLERIQKAAEAGFKAIELHWPYDTDAKEVKIACKKWDVKLLALNTDLGDTKKGDSGLAALGDASRSFARALRNLCNGV